MKQKETVPFADLRDIMLNEAKDEKERQRIRNAYSDNTLQLVDKSFREALYPAMKRLSKE